MRTISSRLVIVDRSATGRPGATQPRPPTGRPPVGRPPKGLGDVVDRLARPIAIEIDAVSADFGYPTAVAGCSACSRRRRFLNLVVPDVRSWRAWRGAIGRWRGAWRQSFGRPRLH